MSLGEFLKAAGSTSGAWNCSTLPADWCIALGYPDFAAEWRGVVDEPECEATAQEAGGLVALWRRGIGEHLPALEGARSAFGLEAGDVAVVRAFGFEAGAIWTGRRFAIKAARGLHFAEPEGLEILAAWRPAHG